MDIRDLLLRKRTCSQIISDSESDSETIQATSVATLSITHTSQVVKNTKNLTRKDNILLQVKEKNLQGKPFLQKGLGEELPLGEM